MKVLILIIAIIHSPVIQAQMQVSTLFYSGPQAQQADSPSEPQAQMPNWPVMPENCVTMDCYIVNENKKAADREKKAETDRIEEEREEQIYREEQLSLERAQLQEIQEERAVLEEQLKEMNETQANIEDMQRERMETEEQLRQESKLADKRRVDIEKEEYAPDEESNEHVADDKVPEAE